MVKQINTQTLVAMGVSPAQARLFGEPLRTACARFEINTVERVAAFLAQALHESGGLVHLEESLFYSSPERILVVYPSRVSTQAEALQLTRNPQALANRVYSGRLGNGNISSGDGWKFIGRGLFQLTGRTNYTEAAAYLGRPYVDQPGLVALPADAALTAAWFWSVNGCNPLADSHNFTAITKRINGPAMLGAVERTALLRVATDALA